MGFQVRRGMLSRGLSVEMDHVYFDFRRPA